MFEGRIKAGKQAGTSYFLGHDLGGGGGTQHTKKSFQPSLNKHVNRIFLCKLFKEKQPTNQKNPQPKLF